jgi:hypothetical protein
MRAYLHSVKILFKDFGEAALEISTRIKNAAAELAERTGRPMQYLNSSLTRKEEVARQMLKQSPIGEGLIGILSCVEPCLSYAVEGNRQKKCLELRLKQRKCLHLYYYYLHPVFGFMHLRLQTWFPFAVDLCLNGREWLARQLDQAGFPYRKRDNTFTWFEDFGAAQRLMDQQLETDWPTRLNDVLRQSYPEEGLLRQPLHLEYYWTVSQSEYATDIVFKDRTCLKPLYPNLVHHAIQSFGSPDVLRFLGHTGMIKRLAHDHFEGEVTSDLKRRAEGVRVKHWVNGNSVKMYDKPSDELGSPLRVEVTINHPEPFTVYRSPENQPQASKRWLRMRRGVADLARRAAVSQAACGRYLTALASVSDTPALGHLVGPICQPVIVEGRRFRALNPWSPDDGVLLETISRGEFTLSGFRNRDLRGFLCKRAHSDQERKRQAGWVTRKLALLRAHGLIKKVTATHRYLLTDQGRKLITALLAARQANVDALTKIAA